MTYKITVRKGLRTRSAEVNGPRELALALSIIHGNGLKVSTIKRIVVR